MEGGENHEPPKFSIEVNVPRGGWKLAILWLHHYATLRSAAEDLHCKTVCFKQLFRIVLSKKYNFLNVSLFTFFWNSLRWSSTYTSGGSSEEYHLCVSNFVIIHDFFMILTTSKLMYDFKTNPYIFTSKKVTQMTPDIIHHSVTIGQDMTQNKL